MSILIRTALLLATVLGWLASPAGAAGQTELDRVVSRVNSRIVTQGDVWQARLLKLVDDPSSDDSTRRCLEDRILMLGEISRFSAPLAASEGELQQRRAEWEASVGGSGNALLEKAGMSEGSLTAWFRDDVRIRTYLTKQFGGLPESDRAKARTDWVDRLRQRAGLR